MLAGIEGFDELVELFVEAFEFPVNFVSWERVAAFMTRYHLNSYDALHVATAIEAGVATIATLDADFVRVAGVSVDVVR